MTRRFTLEEATDLAARAIRAAGASDEAALSLARATVSANAHGKGSSGFSHLMDYLAALRAGRIVGDAEPIVTSPAPAAIHCDARGGIAQVGFDRAFDVALASARGPSGSRCSRRTEATPRANSAIIRAVWPRLASSRSPRPADPR